MRDGVGLNATVYRPKEQRAPAPCIFTLTPYIGDSYHDRAMYFAGHGLPFLLVDVRGRGNSEGTFTPFAQEINDGYDVVEWLAKQPYCNGKVSMWGGSYAGFDQWATAKNRPPASGDHRSGRGGISRRGFSGAQQYFLPIPDAVA